MARLSHFKSGDKVARHLSHEGIKYGRILDARDYVTTLGFSPETVVDIFDYWNHTQIEITTNYGDKLTDKQIEGYLEVLTDMFGKGERELAGYDNTNLSYVFKVPKEDNTTSQDITIRLNTGKPPVNCEIVEEVKWVPGHDEVVRTIKCDDDDVLVHE